jgi:membrane-associated HD superfamily phosphohydrolase
LCQYQSETIDANNEGEHRQKRKIAKKKNFMLSKNQYYASASTIIAEWKGVKIKMKREKYLNRNQKNERIFHFFHSLLLLLYFLLFSLSLLLFKQSIQWRCSSSKMFKRITITNCKLFFFSFFCSFSILSFILPKAVSSSSLHTQ